MNIPEVTTEQLMLLVIAWEDGLAQQIAAPLVEKGLLHREPPHFRLTDAGRELLTQHALYKPYLVQAKEFNTWFDCGRNWTQAGALAYMTRLNMACPPRQYRILDEERRVIWSSEE